MLGARLKKRQRHLRKWSRRENVLCYRLYEKDIPEFPCIVDWYQGEAVVWVFRRTRDESESQVQGFVDRVIAEVMEGLELKRDQVHLKERFRQKRDGEKQQYEKFGGEKSHRVVEERDLLFEVNLRDFLDTGLFLDHRVARQWVREKAMGKRVLNLFAYTGSFSTYALKGGATAVTTVDMSRTYTEWAQRNLRLNGLDESRHTLVMADCIEWLEQNKGLRYDLIVCDPPTFSNSKRMRDASFSIDRDHPQLIRRLIRMLNQGGELFFSNNSRSFEWDESGLLEGFQAREMSKTSVPEDFRNRKIHRSWWIRSI